MSVTNIQAVFIKQLKDTIRNMGVLIQYIMFPVMVIIMENAIKIPNAPANNFVLLFSTMYVGMAPLTAMTTILSEEKEKGTLFALRMSNVRPAEYLFGIGSNVMLLSLAGSVVFALVGQYKGMDFLAFIVIMAIGIFLSMILGAVIGILCSNQMTATSLSVPVMLVFSFLPMLSMFNKPIASVSKFTFSQQINNLLTNIGTVNLENILVLAGNAAVILVLFVIAYRKQ